VITDAVGDCVGLIRERTAGEEAIVAWQGTYEPYGALVTSHSRVVHPHLRAGHKGLFAERLDGGVVTGWAGIETPRLTPISTLMYHNRSRTYLPGLGRFLQSDPNASGLAVVASVPHGGRGAGLTVLGADLSALTGDGVHLYQYVRGNPVAGRDPTGLFFSINPFERTLETLTQGRQAKTLATDILDAYSMTQEMLVDWAMDPKAREDECEAIKGMIGGIADETEHEALDATGFGPLLAQGLPNRPVVRPAIRVLGRGAGAVSRFIRNAPFRMADFRAAQGKIHQILGTAGGLPRNSGRALDGGPKWGNEIIGYRLNRPDRSGKNYWHIDYYDWSKGKRGSPGAVSGHVNLETGAVVPAASRGGP
jgi:hypothetical protein